MDGNGPIVFPCITNQLFVTRTLPPSDFFLPPKSAGSLSDSLNSWDWAHHGLLPGVTGKKIIIREMRVVGIDFGQ